MHWIVRGAVALWAVYFAWAGLTGLSDPASYHDLLGISGGDAVTMNTIRADLSSFFIVSAVAAGWAALRPELHRLLYIPAALFGMALVGRAVGVMMGDPFDGLIRFSMIGEALSVLLLIGAQQWLARNLVP
ncbi:MAG: hypothetical protein ABL882_03065 [Sphingopyxis sp.]